MFKFVLPIQRRLLQKFCFMFLIFELCKTLYILAFPSNHYYFIKKIRLIGDADCLKSLKSDRASKKGEEQGLQKYRD